VGLATSILLPAAPLRVFAAQGGKPLQREEIDAALQAKVATGEIPGVVAMAANQQSVVYQRAFGVRSMASATRL